ncbi:MAG TPA: hypothetical protein VFM57_10970 [Thermoleophilaceae bacterium]|nr:hypothetical protein [Thermoleophilaceae bacterium]
MLIFYAGLWALLDLVALLPHSDPSFSSTRGAVAGVLIQGLLLWRLARGSALAWTFGLLMALGAVASLFLQATPFGAAMTLIVVVCLAQARVLLTPPLIGLVRSQRRMPPASA